jgi:uncharacterized membrane protein
MDKGDNVDLRCPDCGNNSTYHVNDVIAIPNKYVILIATVVLIVACPIIGYFIYDYLFNINWSYSFLSFSGIILFPVTVYGMLLKSDRTAVSGFNRSRLRDKN